MSEFSNRIDAQRSILQIVNKNNFCHEELFALSHKAIDRWCATNRLNHESELVLNIKEAAKKLFFLANKSQEQITEDYRLLSKEINDIAYKIKKILSA
ncbi:hypothetical protein [Thiothrix winogradskyi]|uniref:Uncharacterized protein n=1 Tax=Thiothrix winogradskyi TaxID=96472 RepID=A0ABY3SWM8_9GAMM|nr:hypothetical protein [Thiothrix winogradskyi]UJS23568.1 hypothetical protein L2Y54_16715 [Thiothrix winogradskyi]